MNTASHLLLKFSMRCWKHRNEMIHGSTRQEKKQLALQHAREKITDICNNPPQLAPQYRSIFEIPLAHRLKMPLQAAEHWLSLIDHQVKVTQHNLKILLGQHKPMAVHFHTMRREARQQKKDQQLPATPTKAHSRAVQAAVREMRAKLYAPKVKHPKPQRKSRGKKTTRHSQRSLKGAVNEATSLDVSTTRPPLRHHPP
mmetsp:Transcript_750/g.1138  ORF Transcript_750/g.1138 Transcript_750/m.1138 type:complete len:199 (+) Transcript_750:2038-2634(+)